MKLLRYFLISIFLLGFSSNSFANFPLSYSSYCGYGPIMMYYYPVLNQRIINVPSLMPYTYCPEILCDSFKKQADYNLKSWATYFDNKIDNNTLQKLIYNTDRESYVKLFNGQTENESLNKVSPEKKREFLKYMILAIQSQNISSNSYKGSGWYQGEDDNNDDIKPELLNKFSNQIHNIKDPFMKNRYGFQLVRLAHYLGDNTLALQFFDQYVSKNETNDYMYYRALEQRSGAAFNLNKQAEAASGFINVFANLPDRQEVCAKSLNEIRWNEIDYKKFFSENTDLLDAKTFYKVYYTNASVIKEMNKLVDINPNSKYLKLLAVREADKIQQSILPALYIDFEILDSEYGNSKESLSSKELMNFANQQINNSQVKDKDFWKIIKGFTFIGSQKESEAINLMNSISNSSKLSIQAQRLKFTAQVLQISTINRAQINKSFNTLKSNKNLYSYEPVNALFFNHIAELYKKEHNDIMANYTYWFFEDEPQTNMTWKDVVNKPNSYLLSSNKYTFVNDTTISKVSNIIKNPEQTAFEKFVLKQINQDTDDYLNDLKGTYYLANHKLDEAIKSFEKIKTSKNFYKEKFRPQIFSGAIHEYFDTPFMRQSDQIHLKYIHAINKDNKAALKLNNNSQVEQYNDNKLALTKAIKHLESLAKTDTKNAGDYYYMLGNAYYNMSRRGWFLNNLFYMDNNSRRTVLGYNYSNNEDKPNKRKQTSVEKTALMFFEKAAEISKNDEIKAKATFMQAKVNPCFIEVKDSNSGWKTHIEICDEHKAIFDKLNKKYSDTQFEKDIIKECTWYRNYIY